jgi:DNA replication protein DnaC
MQLTPQLMQLLKQLRLSGIVDTLEVRNRQAVETKLSYIEFLSQLATDEVERREQKKLATRLRRAAFHGEKTLEGFDFDVVPMLNRQWILDLSTCNFIREHANVLLVGPSGIGKSHLADALGHTACRRGFDVVRLPVHKLLGQLYAARADGSYDRKLAYLARVDLLILDDFALKPLRSPHDEDFHELVAERYERGSIILTSNRDFTEWGSAFANPLIASATVDRLRHGAHCITIDGPSYRNPLPPPSTETRKGRPSAK